MNHCEKLARIQELTARIDDRLHEFARGEQVAKLIGVKPMTVFRGSNLAKDVAGSARVIRQIDKIKGPNLRAAMQPKRAKLAKDAKNKIKDELRSREAILRDHAEAIQDSLGSRNYESPLARVTRDVRKRYGL